ncbi:MAG: RNA 2',3'-cyclic phosphodiesterase [Archaeoglobi archaeon]|nr:RNA 2',3'-cyclic phosphodiesterase [Candidatus Mnemosynella sp.]
MVTHLIKRRDRMIRCFVAVNLNDEIKKELEKLQKRFEDLPLKFVKPESMHITLKFLGEVEESRVRRLMEKMEEIRARSFTLRVEGLGVFPNERVPRVLWAGVSGDFREVYHEVERITSELGFPKEKRAFHPHVTIARIKYLSPSERDEMIGRIKGISFEGGEMRVESIELMKSTLLRTGAVYEPLKSVRLHD